MRRLALSILLVGANQAAAQRTAVIDGVVTDSALRPVVGANVTILGAQSSVITGDNGRFRIFSLASGDYQLPTRRIGFEAVVSRVRLADAETLRVSVLLEPVATKLAPVAVTARLT